MFFLSLSLFSIATEKLPLNFIQLKSIKLHEHFSYIFHDTIIYLLNILVIFFMILFGIYHILTECLFNILQAITYFFLKYNKLRIREGNEVYR